MPPEAVVSPAPAFRLPRSPADRAAVGTLAVGLLGLGYALVSYWGWDVAAIDRYLIVAGAVWAVSTAWPGALARPPRPHAPLGLTAVLLAAVLYLPVWFLTLGTTAGRVVLMWWQWGCLGLAAAGYALIRVGPGAVRAGLFPPVFLAFALPLPTAVERPLQTALQHATTTAAHAVFRAVGASVERPGNGFVLRLPGGDLGVEEACSGVRSLTALTALAAFVAFRRGFGPVRGVGLVAAALPIVVAVNALRVVLSGAILEWAGDQYIRGTWHDALGLVMIVVGLGGICLVAQWLDRPRPTRPDAAVTPAEAQDRGGRWASVTAAGVLVAAAVLSALGGWRAKPAVSVSEPTPDLSTIPVSIGGWVGTDRPIASFITESLQTDAIAHREYRNALGLRAQVWVLYWSAAGRVKGYHHPDVCLPSAGMTMVERGVEPIRPSGGGEIPVTARTLAGDRGRLYALYWTQEGRRVWGEEDERAASAGLGLRGLVAQLRTAGGPPPGGRLVVLVGTEDTTGFGRSEVREFTRALADEVYRVCPWASPPGLTPQP